MATTVATAELTQGLLASADAPVRAAFVQLVGGGGQLSGPYGFVQAGIHPWGPISLYGQAGYEAATGWQAGGGCRWEFA